MNRSKILIINPFGIGDVIFSTPLIETLKAVYPDSFIGYVCNKRAYEIIKTNPKLNKIFIYEKDEFRSIWHRSKAACIKKILDFLNTIKRERFDIAIDLSLGYQYSLLLKFIGIGERVGFNYKERGIFLTKKMDMEGFTEKHVIEYYLDMLRLLDIDPTRYKTKPKIYLTEQDIGWADEFLKENDVSERELLIGLIPGGGASWGRDADRRRWDKEGFAKACDSLIDHYGAKIIFFGDSREAEICMDIQKMMKHNVILSCGKTTLGGAFGLLNRCALVITNDGGPLHMAVSAGVKTVSIFGPVDERIYGPYPLTSDHIVISKSDMPCRPCYKKFKYKVCQEKTCLKDVKYGEVLAAVDKLLTKANR